MGFFVKIPVHGVGGPKNVWDTGGYGLSRVWVTGGSTVYLLISAAMKVIEKSSTASNQPNQTPHEHIEDLSMNLGVIV